MTTLTAHPVQDYPQLRGENIAPPAAARRLANIFLVIGLIGLGGTVAGGLTSGRTLHAIAAYHVGATMALSISLGGMFFVMVFHLTNAGWASTIRRQCENLMSLVPWCALLVLAGIVVDTMVNKSHDRQLWNWLHDSVKGNALLKAKSGFLNPTFFIIRAAVYVLLWTLLSRSLLSFSVRQDRAADPSLNAKARKMSAWGMLLFALSVAFSAFDWLMSLDFTFFSTMWGVYFFAGSAYAGVAVTVLLLNWLCGHGRLEGVVTREHFHDTGKLLLAFTVFWSYIAFSQYMLIWYGNIPEETAFFNARVGAPESPGGPLVANPWVYVGALLCVLHFALPFPFLLFRGVKQRRQLLTVMALLALAAHFIDLFWIVRPNVYPGNESDPIGLSGWWIDAAGLVGAMGVFGFLLMRRVSSGPLVAVHDAWIHEGMEHKNYV